MHRPKIAKELPPHRPKKEFQNIFSNASKKNKTPDTQADTTMTVKLNNDNGLQTWWTRTPAGNNKGLNAM